MHSDYSDVYYMMHNTSCSMRLMLFIFVSYYVIIVAFVVLCTSAFIGNNRKLAGGDVVAGYPSPRPEVQFTFQLSLCVCTCIAT